MILFFARRVLSSVVTLWLLITIVFVTVRLMGDPTDVLAESGDAAFLEATRVKWGLDQSYPIQYLKYLATLLSGDFGLSFNKGVSVATLYLDRLPNSLVLGFAAFVIAMGLGIPLGIVTALKVNTWWDGIGKVFAILGLSIPNFVVGLILIVVFGVYLRWFPVLGTGDALFSPAHLILPAFALGWSFSGTMLRITRSSMLEVLGSDFIKLVRLKGMPEAIVLGKHALLNSMLPILTLAGLNLVTMINVAVAIEVVFSWPGVGLLLFEGMVNRDFPLVQGIVLLMGVMIIGVNLVIDLLYAYIDPRIRLT